MIKSKILPYKFAYLNMVKWSLEERNHSDSILSWYMMVELVGYSVLNRLNKQKSYLMRCTNLNFSVSRSKSAGFWVIGQSKEESVVICRKLFNIFDIMTLVDFAQTP